jgi:thiol:disulfide interchange protein
MSNEEVQDQQTPASDAAQCESRACCPLQGRWGLLLWALLIGGIVYMQWPMLKGMYYKVTNAEAPASAVAWRTGFDAALAESGQTGKPILVDFTASWCPPCKVMKHEVWPDAQVAAVVNDGYVPLLVDVDAPENADVARKYAIQGIPTILVIDATGAVLRSGSFMSKGDMLDFLKPSA